MDLFHAVSRVVTQIPKRHPFHAACSSDFAQVFRDSEDWGLSRTKPTPNSEKILNNLDEFETKWKTITFQDMPILTVKALDEIRKLRKHITDECISDIPIGYGSERNENLHKWLRAAVNWNRLSVTMALALFTTYFYVWNEKWVRGSKDVIPPVDCLIDEIPNDLKDETFGIPHRNVTQENLPRIFLEQYTQYPCNIDISTIEFTNHGVMDNDTDDPSYLKKDELLFIIEQTIITHIQYQSMKDKGLLAVFNLRFLNLMQQQALFAFDTFHYQSDSCDDIAKRLGHLISGLGFTILSVPKNGDCLFTSVLLQLEQMLPLSPNKELSAHVQML